MQDDGAGSVVAYPGNAVGGAHPPVLVDLEYFYLVDDGWAEGADAGHFEPFVVCAVAADAEGIWNREVAALGGAAGFSDCGDGGES